MALTTINSGGVKDDSIVNADIKSDAAIAGTKVAPDFGSQDIVTTGDLTVKEDDYGRIEIIPTAGNGGTAVIKQTTTSPRNGGDLAIQVDSSIQGGNLLFRTGGNNERLRITSAGKVGIGEDAPNSILHLGAADNSNHEAILTLNNGGASGNEAGIEWLYEASTTPRAKIWLDSSGQDLRFATANGERLRIDGSGRLLTGTTVSSDQNAKIQSVITSGNDVFAGRRFVNDAGPAIIRLSKSRSASAEGNTIVNNGDEVGRINFSAADGSDYNDLGYISAVVDGAPGAGADMPGRLAFFTTPDSSGTPIERLRITSAGNIKYSGSSTADETNKLGRFLMPSHDTNEEDVMYFQMENEATFNQLTIGGGSSSYNAATNIIFRTAAVDTVTGTERLRIASDGVAHFAGDVKVLTGDVIMGNNRGINFSATTSGTGSGTSTTHQTLDEYEEGTWTPGISSGGFTSLGGGTGHYTRIGNLVTVWMADCALTGTGNSDVLKISGLPFTVVNWTAGTMYAAGYQSEGTQLVEIAASGQAGAQTELRVIEWGSEATGNDFVAGYFVAQVTYRTT